MAAQALGLRARQRERSPRRRRVVDGDHPAGSGAVAASARALAAGHRSSRWAPDALATLAQDQRLSLLVAGRDRLSRETRERLDRMDLRWIHDRAPFSFRRYASAFTIENGRLVVPGGDAALPGVARRWSGRPTTPPRPRARTCSRPTTPRAPTCGTRCASRRRRAVDYFTGAAMPRRGGLLRRVFDRLDESAGRVRQLAGARSPDSSAGAIAADRRRSAASSPSRRAASVAGRRSTRTQPPATLAHVPGRSLGVERAKPSTKESSSSTRWPTRVDRLGPDRSACRACSAASTSSGSTPRSTRPRTSSWSRAAATRSLPRSPPSTTSTCARPRSRATICSRSRDFDGSASTGPASSS